MNKQSPDFTAVEGCLQSLEHLFIDMQRLKSEEEYEEMWGAYGDVRVQTLDAETPETRLVVTKTIRLRGRHKEPWRIAVRLARELKVWARLQHPHLLPLVGFHLDKGYKHAVLISDYMIHGDLYEYIRREKPSWGSRVHLTRDVTDGLVYLHQLEPPVRHGDIKPRNVLINAERRAMLTDFGLSKALEDGPSGLTTSEGLKGTLRYYSPWLVKEMDTDYPLASDVWALGCLMLEVLAERLPYAEKKTHAQVMLALAKDELPAEINSLSILTLDLKLLLETCWALPPSERSSASHCIRILNSEVLSLPTSDHLERIAVQSPQAPTSLTPAISRDSIPIPLPKDGSTAPPTSMKASTSSTDATLGNGTKPRFFYMLFVNFAAKEKTVFSVTEMPLNEDWVVTIEGPVNPVIPTIRMRLISEHHPFVPCKIVKGSIFTGGPARTKMEAKNAAGEIALRAFGRI